MDTQKQIIRIFQLIMMFYGTIGPMVPHENRSVCMLQVPPAFLIVHCLSQRYTVTEIVSQLFYFTFF